MLSLAVSATGSGKLEEISQAFIEVTYHSHYNQAFIEASHHPYHDNQAFIEVTYHPHHNQAFIEVSHHPYMDMIYHDHRVFIEVGHYPHYNSHFFYFQFVNTIHANVNQPHTFVPLESQHSHQSLQLVEDFQQRAVAAGSEDSASVATLQKCEELLPGEVSGSVIIIIALFHNIMVTIMFSFQERFKA